MSARPDVTSSTPEPSHGPVAALEGVQAALRLTLLEFRALLSAAGLPCRALAFQGPEPAWTVGFEPADAVVDGAAALALAAAWAGLCAQVDARQPTLVTSWGTDRLVAARLQLPMGLFGVVGICFAPPHAARLQAQLNLALGWLQLALAAQAANQDLRASRLLELLAYVGAHVEARAGAQDWVNRTAAWARAELPSDAALALSLFRVGSTGPRPWVHADAAWSEASAPGMAVVAELAAAAAVEQREQSDARGWALPLMADGEPVAVLVARSDAALPAATLALLRASAVSAEPLLRHWRTAQASWGWHTGSALGRIGARIAGPGHWVWKLGAAGVVIAAAVLVLWPVPDRVTATVVIEGRTRHVVAAPFNGFVAAALVRPGERVQADQVLARLDDRELRLEAARYRSARDQAGAKLRQGMAERDATAVALAGAEVRQAEAQLALVDTRLARVEVRAPIAGFIVSGDWQQQIGAPIENGRAMFEVASLDDYRVVLHVPDRDITRVQPGQPGVLRLTGQPHLTHDFVVRRITAIASVEDGTNGFRVEAAWQGPVPSLTPGMQGVGKVSAGESSLLNQWTRPLRDWLRLKLWSWWW